MVNGESSFHDMMASTLACTYITIYLDSYRPEGLSPSKNLMFMLCNSSANT